MVRPMYHRYSRNSNAFTIKNEFFFGDLIVAPITSPRDKDSCLAATDVWLPEGTYIDIFNGRIYSGDRRMTVYRDISSMPVFAKAGTILPLAAPSSQNGVENPTSLEICVFGGDNGSFTMVEDNGKVGDAIETARTEFNFTYGKESVLSFTPAACESVPDVRDFALRFVAFSKPQSLTATVNGEKRALDFAYDAHTNTVTAKLAGIRTGDAVTVILIGDGILPENEVYDTAYEMLAKAQCTYSEKQALISYAKKNTSVASRVQEMLSRKFTPSLRDAIIELLCAK